MWEKQLSLKKGNLWLIANIFMAWLFICTELIFLYGQLVFLVSKDKHYLNYVQSCLFLCAFFYLRITLKICNVIACFKSHIVHAVISLHHRPN